MYVYRLLRPDEDYTKGISAKNTASTVTVFNHVLHGSQGPGSKYISTCADLKALKDNFAPHSINPGKIVKIDTSMLQIIDLRQQLQRDPYIPSNANQESIKTFNNYAKKFEEVLLVDSVPADYITLA